MITRRDLRRGERGFSIIEGMIASIVMLIGLLGLASLQVVGVRSNHFGRHLSQASQLAQDLAENMQRWDYNDARLTPTTTRSWTVGNATSDAAVDALWDMGRAAAPSYTADFTDDASGASKTGQLTAGYTGLSGDVNGTGVLEYSRYWNVWTTSFDGTTTTGKTIQIIVRWKEPGLGWRQTAASTFKELPNQMDTGL